MKRGHKKAQKRHKFTALFALLILISACVRTHGQTPRSADEPTTGMISGRVVNENGQPLAGASLFVRAANSITTRTTTTDVEGNFRVIGLEPALYIVSASSPAYTMSFSDPFTPTYYRIGDSVKLELVRGGVITGAVTNASGEPVIQVRVRASMVRNAKGETLKRPAIGFYEENTDDRGVYRFYGLPPGTYIVSAGGSGFSNAFNPYDSDVPTYAPSSTRDTATEVNVRSGEESNADIRYRGEPGHTVSGTVLISSNNTATITLMPAGGLTPTGYTFQNPVLRGFAFNGVADGDYELAAQEFVVSSTTMQSPQVSMSEIKRITVKGANITGIELSTRPLSSISGRISLETPKIPECQGKRAPLLSEMLVHFRRDEKDAVREVVFLRTFASPAPIEASGAFVLRNVLPGRYQFEPRFYARYWYLQSITLQGAAASATAKSQLAKIDAAANWTTVKPSEQLTNLTITLAAGAASLRGRLATEDSATGMVLYLVPAEGERAEDVLRYFVTPTAADGTFAFNNLPPGRYFAVKQSSADAQTATLEKLRQPESATARTKLRRAAETTKTEIELKPCQNLIDYPLKQ